MAKTDGSSGREQRRREQQEPRANKSTYSQKLAEAKRYSTKNAVAVQQKPPYRGRVVRAFGADPTKRYAVRYELREMDELITSNTPTGAVNEQYPAELQPRDRTRAASKAQIVNMATNLVPEAYTTEFNSLDRGAPIIGSDNVVESGNGRTMALRQAVEINESGYSDYKTSIKQSASDFGIDPLAVDTFERPVLVRIRVDDVDRVTFARDANTTAILGYSDTEKSKSDANLISARQLFTFDTDGTNINADLSKRGNREFVRSFVTALPDNERATVVDRSGDLTQSGRQRIKAAMLSRVYDDSRMADRIFESTDSETRNVSNGLMGSLGKIAIAEERVRRGERRQELSIAPDIVIAVNQYATLKETGMSLDVYLGQGNLLGDDLSHSQKRILVEIDKRKRSGKKLAEFFGSWADIVEKEPHPNQVSLFEQSPQSKDDLIDRWIKETSNRENTAAQSMSLF